MSKITKKRLQLYIKRKLAGIKKEYMYRTTKVKDNKILFLTFQGAYTCNPRYICDEILKREKNWDLVWVVDDLSEETRKEFPKEVRLVERNTNKYF